MRRDCSGFSPAAVASVPSGRRIEQAHEVGPVDEHAVRRAPCRPAGSWRPRPSAKRTGRLPAHAARRPPRRDGTRERPAHIRHRRVRFSPVRSQRGGGRATWPALRADMPPTAMAAWRRKRTPSSRSSTGTRSSAEWISRAAVSASIVRIGKKPYETVPNASRTQWLSVKPGDDQRHRLRARLALRDERLDRVPERPRHRRARASRAPRATRSRTPRRCRGTRARPPRPRPATGPAGCGSRRSPRRSPG